MCSLKKCAYAFERCVAHNPISRLLNISPQILIYFGANPAEIIPARLKVGGRDFLAPIAGLSGPEAELQV